MTRRDGAADSGDATLAPALTGVGVMRTWVLALGCVLIATPAAAQAPDAPAAQAAPITVMTRLRHVSTVVMPETAEIVEVVAGAPEYWDVWTAAHLVFLRPLAPGARSNVVVLTAAGDVVPIAVVESAEATVDAVVRVETPAVAPASIEPVLARRDAASATAARAAEAWEAVGAAGVQAAERIEAARTAARNQLDAGREAYPRELQFDYRWAEGAAHYPWLVEAMWHDGRRTYLRTRAIAPTLYERVDGELAPVTVSAAVDDVLYVAGRVLGAGALEVGGRRLTWSASPRKAGP